MHIGARWDCLYIVVRIIKWELETKVHACSCRLSWSIVSWVKKKKKRVTSIDLEMTRK